MSRAVTWTIATAWVAVKTNARRTLVRSSRSRPKTIVIRAATSKANVPMAIAPTTDGGHQADGTEREVEDIFVGQQVAAGKPQERAKYKAHEGRDQAERNDLIDDVGQRRVIATSSGNRREYLPESNGRCRTWFPHGSGW